MRALSAEVRNCKARFVYNSVTATYSAPLKHRDAANEEMTCASRVFTSTSALDVQITTANFIQTNTPTSMYSGKEYDTPAEAALEALVSQRSIRLACHHDHVLLQTGLANNPAPGVEGEARMQNGVKDPSTI